MFASNTSQVANDAVFIEDTFACHLYTGNGSSSTRSITTGVDSSTYGSLVWIKNRTVGGTGRNNYLTTTALSNAYLLTNTTDAAVAQSAPYPVDPTSTGFNLNTSGSNVNTNGHDYVSWTFRKQPKFFDVVTYTGDDTERTISHNLGSVPGCIIVKRTDTTSNWTVYHRELNATNAYQYYISLNLTTAKTADNIWGAAPTSTVFTVTADAKLNASGGTYVAYLFAHDAGGFGLTGTDNVISCGSFVWGNTGTQTVNLGYEPQWILCKQSTGVDGWFMFDTMRNDSLTGQNYLLANSSAAEAAGTGRLYPTATGFAADPGGGNQTYIYIAIRRGPMKVPTSGTSVFIPLALNNASDTKNTTGFPVDLQFQKYRAGLNGIAWFDRLRGLSSVPSSQSATTGLLLRSSSTAAEVSTDNLGTQYGNTSFNTGGANGGVDMIYWNLRRAPSFFDEVCYTGTGTTTQIVYHNLNSEPNLVIQKRRNSTSDWYVSVTDGAGSIVNTLLLNTTGATGQTQACAYTSPTYFGAFDSSYGNISGATYVAYLFATCAGVSKVGSYTGTGTTLQVNCGFTGGARFVLIKRTDSTGDWYVWDTARGIVSGNDPYLLLNSAAAEATGTDYIDTYSAGFEISSTAPAAINASGGTFIFLAIA